MTQTAYIDIRRQLEALEFRKSIGFGVLAFERALPNFHQFQKETSSNGGSVLMAALTKCWASLEQSSVDLSVGPEDCIAVAPDTEAFKSAYTSAALDATTIAANLLTFLGDHNPKWIVEISTARRDTIDLFVQIEFKLDPHEAGFEASIMNHPLMQKEIGDQLADLAFLNKNVGVAEMFGWVVDRGYRELSMKGVAAR